MTDFFLLINMSLLHFKHHEVNCFGFFWFFDVMFRRLLFVYPERNYTLLQSSVYNLYDNDFIVKFDEILVINRFVPLHLLWCVIS